MKRNMRWKDGLSRSVAGILALVMAVSALVACAPTPASTTPAPMAASAPTTAAGAPTASATVSATSAQLAVISAYGAAIAAKSFRIYSTTAIGTQAPQEVTIEVVLPDRFHVIGPSGYELIIIGNQVYQKIGGTWTMTNVDFNNIIANIIGTGPQITAASIGQVKFVGTGTVNGVMTNIYEYSATADVSGQQVNATIKLWIDPNTSLPLEQQIDATAVGIQTMTMQVIQYDPNIKIEAPTP